MGRSFLVEETESGVLKDKIRIRFKEFKNDFAAKTDKLDSPSSTHAKLAIPFRLLQGTLNNSIYLSQFIFTAL